MLKPHLNIETEPVVFLFFPTHKSTTLSASFWFLLNAVPSWLTGTKRVVTVDYWWATLIGLASVEWCTLACIDTDLERAIVDKRAGAVWEPCVSEIYLSCCSKDQSVGFYHILKLSVYDKACVNIALLVKQTFAYFMGFFY